MDGDQWIQLLVLVMLLALSAFFSSAETALTTVNRLRVRALVDENNKRAKVLEKVIDDQGKMLTAILIGNNIVNISASSLATVFVTEFFGSAYIGAATGVLTILVLIFGEISPKTIATLKAEQMALSYARIIYILMIITTPIIVLVGSLSRGFIRLLGADPDAKNGTITETELRTMVDVSHEEGIIEKEEKDIISNVFDIGDVEAKDIMVPRIDMTMASVDSTYEELLEIFKEDRFTRIPVYDKSTDDVIGIINMKDILLYDKDKEFHMRDYLREPLYIYEGKNVSELLLEMRQEAVNLCVVLDEYGAVVGLITLEDILEEIVGEIRDEFDDYEEDEIKKINENEYSVDASISIDDINDAIGTSFESEDYDSIGGLMIEKLDRLPSQGERVSIGNCTLLAGPVVKNRITRVRIFKHTS